MNIKRIFAELEKEEKALDALDALFEMSPENEQIEKAWDDQYKKVFGITEKLVNAIVTFTAGMMDKTTARAVIQGKRTEFKSLLARWAA